MNFEQFANSQFWTQKAFTKKSLNSRKALKEKHFSSLMRFRKLKAGKNALIPAV